MRFSSDLVAHKRAPWKLKRLVFRHSGRRHRDGHPARGIPGRNPPSSRPARSGDSSAAMPPIHETLRGGPGPSELHGAIITCVHGRRRSSLLALPPSANVACVAVASENQGVCGHAAASCQAFKSRRRGSQPLCNSTVASPSEVVTLLLRAVEHPSATTTALPMKRSFRPQWASGAYRVEQLLRRRT